MFLENFRCFYGTVEIPFNNLIIFIGRNDQGKSSILEALDIFINEGNGAVKIESKDLNVKAQNEGENDFRIGLVFDYCPNEIIIDATNKTSLREEYLLNSDGDLEIWKSFIKGKLKSTFIKCNHPSNDDFLKDLLTKKIKDLQNFVNDKKLDVSDKRKAAELRKAIRSYYEKEDGKLNLSLISLSIDTEGLKEIWEMLKKKLPVYALFHSDRKNLDQDDEIQDPLKIKIEQIFKRDEIQQKLDDIAKEIDSELRNIANITVNKYKNLTNSETEIVPNIPEYSQLKWKDVYKNIGYNTNDNIPLNKRGSGIRRIVLLSSFLADIERKNDLDDNHIIYAIEEPETSLHPDLQLKLIKSLCELSKSEKYQIILTTHSPSLIKIINIDDIRFVEQENGTTKISCFDESTMDKIINTMGLLPTIGKVVICVEGKNDEKFLININKEIDELKKTIDLESKIEANLLAFVLVHGSNVKEWIDKYALKNTNAIEFHLYDRDKKQEYKSEIDKVNERKDGSKGLLTKKREIENYIPKEKIESEFGIKINLNQSEKWDDIDIPKKVRDLKNNLRESDIKSIICGKLSKQIKKEDLLLNNAWEEVESWFTIIKELIDKVCL